MENNKLLERQLSKFNLSPETLPTDLKTWQDLLSRIARAYQDIDQETYLLQRSMEISSREMTELNEKLLAAQEIARLGYWTYDQQTEKITWSKELYKMFGYDSTKNPPTFYNIFDLMHPDDREKHRELVEKSLATGEDYEVEIRFHTLNLPQGAYSWFLVIGHPILLENQHTYQLSGVVMDINNRKKAEEEIEILHQQVITSARRAGMADVATSILHNVGNILNSANVSLNLISEHIHQVYFAKLFAVEKMFEENIGTLNQYLTEDPKGKLIPQYLISLIKNIETTQKEIIGEVKNMNEHIHHIKEITDMQKSISGVSGMPEKIFIPEIIDAALNMCGRELEKRNINLEKKYDEKFFIMTDKSKLLQILVNLIQNAKDAVLANMAAQKKIILIEVQKYPEASPDAAPQVKIDIRDNGLGILPENLTQIFAFGFTTKPNGHGFGLHSSALAAKELGGKLEATSKGINEGATFSLILPLENPIRREGHGDKKLENYSY